MKKTTRSKVKKLKTMSHRNTVALKHGISQNDQ